MAKGRAEGRADLLQGTLGLLVLRVLERGPLHGYGIAARIAETSGEMLRVEEGSLYPALYRLEARDLIRSHWEESKTGRRVKVYSVTAAGRKQLAEQRDEWAKFAGALATILKVSP